eukprot:g13180.t1
MTRFVCYYSTYAACLVTLLQGGCRAAAEPAEEDAPSSRPASGAEDTPGAGLEHTPSSADFDRSLSWMEWVSKVIEENSKPSSRPGFLAPRVVSSPRPEEEQEYVDTKQERKNTQDHELQEGEVEPLGGRAQGPQPPAPRDVTAHAFFDIGNARPGGAKKVSASTASGAKEQETFLELCSGMSCGPQGHVADNGMGTALAVGGLAGGAYLLHKNWRSKENDKPDQNQYGQQQHPHQGGTGAQNSAHHYNWQYTYLHYKNGYGAQDPPRAGEQLNHQAHDIDFRDLAYAKGKGSFLQPDEDFVASVGEQDDQDSKNLLADAGDAKNTDPAKNPTSALELKEKLKCGPGTPCMGGGGCGCGSYPSDLSGSCGGGSFTLVTNSQQLRL